MSAPRRRFIAGCLCIAGASAVTRTGYAQARPQVVIVQPVVTSCWEETTYFRTNVGAEVVDYCHAGPSRHYVPGEVECYYRPVTVCSLYTPPTCPPGCPQNGPAVCPACDANGHWDQTREEAEPIPFPCPEGRPPPEC